MQDNREQNIAVLDIGSNSVRLVIYQVSGLAFTHIYNEKVMAGLGRGIRDTGRLNPEGKVKTLAALKRFALLIKGLGLRMDLVAATAAMRVATDAQDFIEVINRETGFQITPLLGEEEAYLTAMGVLSGEPRAEGICADLGGASLELTPIAEGRPEAGVSLALGPFAVYQGALDIEPVRNTIREELAKLDKDIRADNLYLIGGAWRNMALIDQARTEYPLKVLQNYTWSHETAHDLARWGQSAEGQAILRQWPGLRPERADTLPYSCLMLEELMGLVKPESVIIAPDGVRDGLVLNTFFEERSRHTALLDACADLAKGNREGAVFGDPLFSFLSDAAQHFPRTFSLENENTLRNAACDLVGIGKGLHPDHKAKMVFRSVLYAPLPGLTHKERAYLALMLFASYTSKENSPNQQAIDYWLDDEEKKAARIYGFAMRFGVTLSARSAYLLMGVKFEKNGDSLEVRLSRDRAALKSEKLAERLEQIATLLGCQSNIIVEEANIEGRASD